MVRKMNFPRVATMDDTHRRLPHQPHRCSGSSIRHVDLTHTPIPSYSSGTHQTLHPPTNLSIQPSLTSTSLFLYQQASIQPTKPHSTSQTNHETNHLPIPRPPGPEHRHSLSNNNDQENSPKHPIQNPSMRTTSLDHRTQQRHMRPPKKRQYV